MAFEFVKSDRYPNYPLLKKVPSTAGGSYTVGEGLVITNGAATKVGATVKPAYIAAQNYTAPASGNRAIAVYPVDGAVLLSAPLQADGAALKVGSAVTIHTDGLQVTATTTSGVFTIEKMEGTGVGSNVLGRFK